MSGAASDGSSIDPAGDRFFGELPELSDFARAAELEHYVDAPPSWALVITDVRGSTRAIEAGRYKDVNAVGVSSIVAIQNALAGIELPYVFGGDGATLLVPSSRLPAVERALRGVKELASEAFELELRAATVPVSELAAAGERIGVARLRISPDVCLALFAGGGMALAERWVKDPVLGPRYEVGPGGESAADLEGFECRWRPLESRNGQIISLLVLALARDGGEREATYKRTITLIESWREVSDIRPAALENLKMLGLFADYSLEASVRSRVRSGRTHTQAVRRARKQAAIGRMLMALGKSAGGFDGRRYRTELLENTDFRKFDETLRMVLDVGCEQAEELGAHLARERALGHVVYGLHRSASALMTCFVRSYRGNHVHFVDGSDGGYALASKELKAQLAQTASPMSEARDG